MPFRPTKWKPGTGKKRATFGFSGFGEDAAPPVEGPAPSNGTDMGEGYPYAPPDGSDTGQLANQRGDNRQLLPPVSEGGTPSFSVGNRANGSINLNFLGPRANASFNPNDPSSGLPYQNPGFFRRFFGDTGQQLNAAYVNDTNRAITNRADQMDWLAAQTQAERSLEREKRQWQGEQNEAENKQRWLQTQAQLQGQAAIANATNDRTLRIAQWQNETAEAKERNRESQALFMKTGTYDPILQQQRMAQFSRFHPVGGSSFIDYGEGDSEPTLYSPVGALPGGVDMSQYGVPINPAQSSGIQPRVMRNGVWTPLDGGNSGGGQPTNNVPRIDNNVLQSALEKHFGKSSSADSTSTGTTAPQEGAVKPTWLDRLLNKSVKPPSHTSESIKQDLDAPPTWNNAFKNVLKYGGAMYGGY